jgi:hypothetical protein
MLVSDRMSSVFDMWLETNSIDMLFSFLSLLLKCRVKYDFFYNKKLSILILESNINVVASIWKLLIFSVCVILQ